MHADLEGQTAIVTGAAQGIGRTIAETLGTNGANVVIADVQDAMADDVAAELRSEGIESTAIECDVSSQAATERLTERTLAQYGAIDILVNNAGISTRGEFLDLTPEDWRAVHEVNLTGTYQCSAAVVPTMVDQGGGRVVNISSMAGRAISYHAAANYTASKWGVIGLSKHMAWDLGGDGIRVNVVCPGATLTPLTKSQTSHEDRAATSEKIPLGRWADPEDIANAVLYFASAGGAYVTGTVIEVDGGKQLGVRHEV